jgi:hypothetical protein
MYFMSVTNASSKLFEQLYNSVTNVILRNKVTFSVSQYNSLGEKDKYGFIHVSTYCNSTESSYTISKKLYFALLKNISERYIKELASSPTVQISASDSNQILAWLPSLNDDEHESQRFGTINVIEINTRAGKLSGADGTVVDLKTLKVPIGLQFTKKDSNTQVSVLSNPSSSYAILLEKLQNVSGLQLESNNIGIVHLVGGDYITLDQ